MKECGTAVIGARLQMNEISGDFTQIKKFDKELVGNISKFFDLSYVKKDANEFRLWFNNLRYVAEQNLGLAHCILHNQSARNISNLAYSFTGDEEFNKPYTDIGAYSFFKGFHNPDTRKILINGQHLTGIKHWASQLDTADYIVMNVRHFTLPVVHLVYLNLHKVDAKIIPPESKPLGMEIALPYDIEVDLNVPKEWILTSNIVHKLEYGLVNNFHVYGLISNYISSTNALLKQAEAFGYSIEYHIKKLKVNNDISALLWEKSLHTVFEGPYEQIDLQYQFARKNLVDTISFFTEILNSGLCSKDTQYSQQFRDALTFSSHIKNLYNHLTVDHGEMRII
jgi:hypothetical protein